MVLSNPCVSPSPGIKISFALLSLCTDELLSAPEIMKFSPRLQSGSENSSRKIKLYVVGAILVFT